MNMFKTQYSFAIPKVTIGFTEMIIFLRTLKPGWEWEGGPMQGAEVSHQRGLSSNLSVYLWGPCVSLGVTSGYGSLGSACSPTRGSPRSEPPHLTCTFTLQSPGASLIVLWCGIHDVPLCWAPSVPSRDPGACLSKGDCTSRRGSHVCEELRLPWEAATGTRFHKQGASGCLLGQGSHQRSRPPCLPARLVYSPLDLGGGTSCAPGEFPGLRRPLREISSNTREPELTEQV